MKPFKINRDSWHYKLNKKFMNDYEHNMWSWEAKKNSFCSYWRATFFRIVALTAFASFIFAVLSMMVLGSIANPMAALAVLGVILAIIAFFTTLVLAHTGYTAYTKKNENKPDSLFVQRYKVYKSKVCPMVEFDGK